MLAILFIGARMRALQMDPVNGSPQKWAQNCFYMCTYAVAAQTILSIIIPLVMQGEVRVGRTEGDMEYEVENKALGAFLTAARFTIMFCIYIGFSCVIWSIFTIQHPKGKEYTPPVSVTMQCVINLTVQFFTIYLAIWIGITLKEFTGFEWALLTQTMENAKATVQFCPMLAILFVGTRMRALQMTANRGAPQGWVQDGMYLASWSVLIQFMMCLLMPVFTGKKYTPDSLDGETKPKEDENLSNPWAAGTVTAIRYIALLSLLGGTATVITGVILMTPETANGRGALPVVADGTLGVDLAPQPPGVNDIPGAKGAMKNVGKTVGGGVEKVDGATETVTGTVTGF